MIFDGWSSGKYTRDHRRKNFGSFFKKHNRDEKIQFFDIYRGFFSVVCTSPLAVITVGGLLDVLMVSNSAELRSRLLTICILAPESTTKSLSCSSFVDAASSTPFLCGRVECTFVVLFKLVNVFLQKFHALLQAHRCCLSVSSWDRSSNFIA